MKPWYLLIVGLVAAFLSGCAGSPFTPEVSGVFAGKALYLVYTRNIDKQPAEVKQKIEALWAEINKVEDVSDLAVVRTLVDERFEAILADSKLTEADRAVLGVIKDEICRKLDEVINAKLTSNKEGLEFLVGVRQGVNEMIALYEEP